MPKATPDAPKTAPLILASIIQEVGAITKNRKNESQGFKFRGIDDIYQTLHPLFASHGMVCLPSVLSCERTQHQNAKKNNVFGSIVTLKYTFHAPDGSTVEAVAIGEGFDFADKATAKALSMAQKYLFIQTFLIPTQDVEDADNDTTIDPREEIKELRRQAEEKAKQDVEAGRTPDLPADQEEALDKKRRELQATIDAREGQPAKDQTIIPPGATVDRAGNVKGGAKPEEPAATAPEAPKKPAAPKKLVAPPQKPTSPPATPPEPPEHLAEEDSVAEPEEEQEPESDPLLDHVITAISHPKYFNRKLGSLTEGELNILHKNWIIKHASEINGSPACEDLRDKLLKVIALRKK